MYRCTPVWALILVLAASLACDETRYGSAIVDRDTGADFGDDVGVVQSAIEGHWRGPEQVGNCIQVEEWWSFLPGGEFLYTVDDQNACYEQAVYVLGGEWSVGSNRQLHLSYTDNQGQLRNQSQTAVVVQNPSRNDLLSTQAWVRTPGTDTWIHREIRALGRDQESIQNTITMRGLNGVDPCHITNSVRVTATVAEGGGTATVEFDSPCNLEFDPLIGWQTVVPVGWEDDGWQKKREVLVEQGLDRAPTLVYLMADRSFWPVVFWDVDKDVLFRSPIRRRSDVPAPEATPPAP